MRYLTPIVLVVAMAAACLSPQTRQLHERLEEQRVAAALDGNVALERELRDMQAELSSADRSDTTQEILMLVIAAVTGGVGAAGTMQRLFPSRSKAAVAAIEARLRSLEKDSTL